MSLKLKVIDPPTIAGIVMRCASDEFEIRDREGRTGRGFTNLKRILGRPADFAFVVDQLAQTIPAPAWPTRAGCPAPARWRPAP
jgi:hypothetical protein